MFRNSKAGLREALAQKMKFAPTYATWLTYASQADRLEGADKWRREASSSL